MDYRDYIAENLDKSISYAEYIAGNLDGYETEQEKLARERKEVRELRNKKLKRVFKHGN
jgi:hypothetical protein